MRDLFGADEPAERTEDESRPDEGLTQADPAEPGAEAEPATREEPGAEAEPAGVEHADAVREIADETDASADAERLTPQEALFTAEVPPLPVDAHEGVTSFGTVEDPEIAAITAGLAADAEQVETPGEDETAGPEQAAEASQADADQEAAVVAATGAPEGASDDADAVEALLDAETGAGVFGLPRDRSLSVPFYVYLGVWLIFSIAMVVMLQRPAASQALDTASSYPIFVFVGLTLTVLGPLLAILLWVIKRSRSSAVERAGLFARALLRGALATFGGVVMWWIALVVLNYMKTGRFF